MKPRTLKKMVAVALVAVAVVTTAGRGSLQAAMVPTTSARDGINAAQQADLQTVRTALENEVVRARLKQMGLSTEQVNERLGRMEPARVHQVAMQIRQQNPAGDGGLTLIIAGAVLLIVLLIVAFGGPHDHDDHNDEHHDEHTDTVPAGGGQQTIIVK